MTVEHEVIHETVEGEVIVVALQTGCYYSLEGTGAEVWAGLVTGRSPSEVAAELEARYSADRGAIPAAVSEFLTSLLDERLLCPVEPNGQPAAAAEPQAPGDGRRAPFTAPVLHKFSDMQDFLLVDPVHEVGDQGWPHLPAPR